MSNNTDKQAHFELTIDLFFALLPVLILAVAYPAFGPDGHSIFRGPDIGLVACVIFGLTLARMLRSGNSIAHEPGLIRLRGLAMSVLGLIPITGLVVSTLVICIVVADILLTWADAAIQILSISLSIVTHIVLGGYSIRSEGN